jgi:hypothetical protein
MEKLPREVQYNILSMVGCRYGNELIRTTAAAYKGRRTTVHPMSATITRDYYRYAIPRFCGSCGEYRPCPQLKCPFCARIQYQLVGWGLS